MSPDNPFLKALLAEPDDDTLRLALADWLDENDQAPRAEFIRVQIELTRGVEDHECRCALEARQRDLLIAHDTEWIRPLADVLECEPGEWGGWVFRRGFVEYFRLSGNRLPLCGKRLAELTPIRQLNLENDSVWPTVWSQPWLRSLTHLYDVSIESDAQAEAILASPYLAGLRHLQVARLNNLSPNVRRRFRKRFKAILC
ncbi:MAG: TIGR02996 domain-containing protein [Gemmataceae bacterium]